MHRRDFLRRSTFIPLACIPFTSIGIPKDVLQTCKSYDERGKYLDYTKQDFMRCKIILIDLDGNKIWAPPINKVEVSREPFRVNMHIKYDNLKYDLHLSGMRFVDKDRRMLFQIALFSLPMHILNTDSLRLEYKLFLN